MTLDFPRSLYGAETKFQSDILYKSACVCHASVPDNNAPVVCGCQAQAMDPLVRDHDINRGR